MTKRSVSASQATVSTPKAKGVNATWLPVAGGAHVGATGDHQSDLRLLPSSRGEDKVTPGVMIRGGVVGFIGSRIHTALQRSHR